MRSSASLSSGRVRSIRSPLVLATSAASARRGLMDLATSSAVVPLGTSFVLPSGSLIWMLSAMGCFRVYHRPRRGGCPHPDLSDDNVYLGPDAPVRATLAAKVCKGSHAPATKSKNIYSTLVLSH